MSINLSYGMNGIGATVKSYFMKLLKPNFLGHKLLFITAHPDDESFLCSGTMVKNFGTGGTNFLICATDGEAGSSHLKHKVTKAQLKTIRRRELEQVSKFLKVKKLYALELPDGKLKDCKETFYRKSLKVAKKEKPDCVLGFGPDGITAHNDHVTAWLVASKVAEVIECPYYAFCMCPKIKKDAEDLLIGRRRSPYYHKKFKFADANIRVPITPSVKQKALSFHVSQLDEGDAFVGYPKYAIKETLAADYFCSR